MNLFVLFCAAKDEKALNVFFQDRYGVDLAAQPFEQVPDALQAAQEDEALVLVDFKPGWSVLMGAPDQCFDEQLTGQLSELSNAGEVLMILSQNVTDGLWLEYHKNGHLHRQWVKIEGEVQVDFGEPVCDLDNLSDGVDEDDSPDFWDLVKVAEKVTGIEFSRLSSAGSLIQVQ